MILARCQVLQGLLGRLKQAESDRKLAATLAPRREELQDRHDELTELAARFRVLRDAGLLPAVELPGTDRLSANLTAVRGNLAGDPFAVTKGRDYRAALKGLEGLAERLRDQQAAAWRGWVDRQTARIDEAELARYETVPGFAEVVAEIRRLCTRVVGLPSRLPASASELAEAKQLLDALRQRIATLPRTDDPEVRAFLDEANGPNGAGLDLVTPNVVAWLQRERLYHRYRVVIR
jgi:hypothetical protein